MESKVFVLLWAAAMLLSIQDNGLGATILTLLSGWAAGGHAYTVWESFYE